MSTRLKRAGFFGVIFASGVVMPAACSSPYGAEPAPLSQERPTPDASNEISVETGTPVPVDAAPPVPECGAQRVVHLIAGNGGLAWFSLLWPVPVLITAPQPA